MSNADLTKELNTLLSLEWTHDNRTEIRQKAFDYVLKRLFKQGGPSIEHDLCCHYSFGTDHTSSCRYRYGTLRCAVGWFIRDEDYLPEFEDRNIDAIIDDIMYDGGQDLHSLIWMCNDIGFFKSLQKMHDNTVGVSAKTWYDALEKEALKMAQAFELEIDTLSTLVMEVTQGDGKVQKQN